MSSPDVRAYGNPSHEAFVSRASTAHSGPASAMVQLNLCEARKGVKFEFPIRRLTL
jgi:hypothetical protein